MPGITYTHMPFLAYIDDAIYRIHCRCPEGSHFWSLYIDGPNGDVGAVATPHSPHSVNCCPTLWQDEHGIHGSYVNGNGPTEPEMPYHLYRMDAPDLASLITSPTISRIMPTHVGYVGQNGHAYGRIGKDHCTICIRHETHNLDLIAAGCWVHRINYRADAPHILLVSGWFEPSKEIWAVHYNLITQNQYLVTCDGEPAYKFCQLAGRTQYAHRVPNGGYEDRTIYEANRITYTPCEILQPIN